MLLEALFVLALVIYLLRKDILRLTSVHSHRKILINSSAVRMFRITSMVLSEDYNV